jgi:hypothetical protein
VPPRVIQPGLFDKPPATTEELADRKPGPARQVLRPSKRVRAPVLGLAWTCPSCGAEVHSEGVCAACQQAELERFRELEESTYREWMTARVEQGERVAQALWQEYEQPEDVIADLLFLATPEGRSEWYECQRSWQFDRTRWELAHFVHWARREPDRWWPMPPVTPVERVIEEWWWTWEDRFEWEESPEVDYVLLPVVIDLEPQPQYL